MLGVGVLPQQVVSKRLGHLQPLDVNEFGVDVFSDLELVEHSTLLWLNRKQRNLL